MKWEDAREKYPEELFNTLKELCEEFNESVNREKRLLTIFCNWCYKTKGSLCFPCVDIKDYIFKNMIRIWNKFYPNMINHSHAIC